MEVLVTRKGQVTIPIELRRKYKIKEGMKIIFEDSTSGIILKVIPRLQDLIGADAEKADLQETIKILDKMRSEDRY
ncbi:MAG: AbrB/MazE/SpoVT family DNA-binding domain-containing protein [Crenarchaeota archaeon]|nr:AbrB/MazE/SpoVT family DNA-binding domain-containing protein [Thermoproteota archaeon]